VVGSDKSVEAPPGVTAALRLFREDVAVLRTTLSGLARLSEHSARHSGDIGSPHPPRRLDDLEVFCRSACRASLATRLAAPAGFASLSGFGPERPLRSVSGPDRPSWGFTPLQRLQRRDPYHPGPPRTRHHPSSGFLTPSTVCSPLRLADTLGPLPLMGFSPTWLFRAVRPRRIAAPLMPFVHGALQSRTLRNTRSRAPQPRRHLSPPALVPRPWSQSQIAPFRAHHSRAVAGAFAPAGPLTCFDPRHLGEP